MLFVKCFLAISIRHKCIMDGLTYISCWHVLDDDKSIISLPKDDPKTCGRPGDG